MNQSGLLHRCAISAVAVVCTMAALGRGPSQASIDPGAHILTKPVAVTAKRAAPPSMIGSPMEFEGDQAGVFASEAWRIYMNTVLEKAGYGPIPGCAERLQTEAFAFIANCDGDLVFTSNMYRAAADMMREKRKQIDVRSGEGLPPRDIVSNNPRDIVDASVIRRESVNVGYDPRPVAPQERPLAYAGGGSGYIDESVPAVLKAPVPQTRRR